MYPRVRIHMDRLRRNLDACAGIIQKVPGCTLMIVTKGVCAYPPIVRMLTGHPEVDFLADSRIQNLKSYAAQARQAGKQTVLLRLSMPSEVSEVVEYADVSFQSELSTIRLLDEAAGRAGKRHNVVLMIDLGDLREGIFYEKEEEIFSTVAELLLLKHIRLGLAPTSPATGPSFRRMRISPCWWGLRESWSSASTSGSPWSPAGIPAPFI